ncbi:MAG: glycosyltransferase, partial [Deltaproteobacteria bacterium]|nr:glycosyltransferase [Deltaproteobacteria bacterium]
MRNESRAAITIIPVLLILAAHSSLLPAFTLQVLFLSPSAGLGGAERALLEMVASLHEQYPRCQITVILGEGGALARKLHALHASTLLVPFPKALALIGDAGAGGPAGAGVSPWRVVSRLAGAVPLIAAYLRRLGGVIRRVAPDVIHSNGFKMHLLGAWAAPHRTPVIWHLHDFVSLRPLIPQLLKLALHRCAGIIANSHSVARDLAATLVRTPAVHTFYYAIDLNNFTPEGGRLDLDSLAGITPAAAGVLRVGLVATMARWKGHEVFLRALAMLPVERIRGYVIGGPIYRTAGSQYSLAELRRMASALHLDGRVGFTGFVNDSAAAIRALDILVHTSVAPEPFGLIVAEAFACGRAVIASRGGGVLEIIRENQNALAHRPGDARELAAALARLLDDPGLRRMLGM